MFCTKCGDKLEETVVFCPKCGTKVLSDAYGIDRSNYRVSEYPIKSTINSSKLVMIIIGSILFIVGLVFIIHGSTLNNSLEAMIRRNSTQPGTVFIVLGIIGLIAGIILLIIGIIKKSIQKKAVPTNKDKLAIASLICGLGGLLIPYALIAGIVLGVLGRNSTRKNMAIAGLIISITVLIIYIILISIFALAKH